MENRSIEKLKNRLSDIGNLSNEYWMDSLPKRIKDELEFHDKYRKRSQMKEIDQDTYEKFYGNKKYYSAVKDSKEYISDWINREVRGRIFLDYCCGDGFNTIKAAKAGAELAIGVDISQVSIENAIHDAHKEGVSDNTQFVQADAENTLLPDQSIDRMICSGVLHHLDLSHAFPEIHRIMASRGKLLAIEALEYNPAIKLYRYLTPQMRTEWEKSHILGLKDIHYAKQFFNIGQIKYWHLFVILEPHFPFLKNIFHTLDNIFTRIPLVQLMAWMFTFELIKPEEKDLK